MRVALVLCSVADFVRLYSALDYVLRVGDQPRQHARKTATAEHPQRVVFLKPVTDICMIFISTKYFEVLIEPDVSIFYLPNKDFVGAEVNAASRDFSKNGHG